MSQGIIILSTQQSAAVSAGLVKNQKTDDLKKMEFFMKLMNITEDDITDDYFGTKTEAEVTVPLFSLYDDNTPPKKEDRIAEANGNNSLSNGFAAKASEQTQTQQTQNTNSNNSHSNRFAATASEQTQTQQTQNTNGNNSHSNGFAATALEPMLGTDSNSTKVFCPKCRGIFSVDQLKLHMPNCQGRSCHKCRRNFTVDQLELHMPTCQGTCHWSFGTRGSLSKEPE